MTKALVRFGSNPPAIERGKPNGVLAGNPETGLQNYFTDESGQFFAGVWESGIGKWKVSYTENEFCTILSGKATVTSVAGAAETFVAGDSFVIPRGFSGTWETIEPVRKHYVIFDPKP